MPARDANPSFAVLLDASSSSVNPLETPGCAGRRGIRTKHIGVSDDAERERTENVFVLSTSPS